MSLYSSGQSVTDQDRNVQCWRVHQISKAIWKESGCGWVGKANVSYDPETNNTHWVCPQCAINHVDLFEAGAW